jgi:hypothetical protein
MSSWWFYKRREALEQERKASFRERCPVCEGKGTVYAQTSEGVGGFFTCVRCCGKGVLGG